MSLCFLHHFQTITATGSEFVNKHEGFYLVVFLVLVGGKNTEVVFFCKCKDDDFQVKRVCIQVFSMVSLVNVNDVYSFVSFYMSIAHDSSILSTLLFFKTSFRCTCLGRPSNFLLDFSCRKRQGFKQHFNSFNPLE